MKRIIEAISFCSLLMLFSGCEQSNVKMSAQPEESNMVWDGNTPLQPGIPGFFPRQGQTGAFPESMVGVWRCVIPGIDWAFKFEPDGSIKKLTHSLGGQIDVAAGGTEGTGPEPGTYYTFVIGPCEAKYIPATRMIKVKIVMDYFIMKLPSGELEGKIEDYFEGPVTEDGKTWNVNWWNFGWLKDAGLPDPNLIRNNPMPLTFTKLDTEDANKF